MKLGAKLRLSYVGIVLIAVSIVLVLIIENAQRELKEKIGRDLQVAARIEADNVDSYIDANIAKIKFFSRDDVFRTADAAAISDYLKQIKTSYPSFAEISIINLAEKTIASTNARYIGNPFLLHEKESMDFFKKAKGSREGEVLFKFGYGNKEKTKVEGQLLTPIIGKKGTGVISVLMASVSLDHILKPVDKFDIETIGDKAAYLVEHASKMIVTQDGKSKVFTPLVYFQPDSNLRDLLKERKEGYVAYKDPKRGAVIAGYADLSEHGTEQEEDWAIISMAPQKEVFSPAVRLRNRMIVLGIIAVIIAWVIAFFVARGISRPVVRLAEVTDKIAKGDLSQRADIKLRDEVGDLARSFNKMTDELNSAIAGRDQEIIERKNVEEKLKKEMEDKANFISMISNEFKPSLTMIRESVNMVLPEVSGKMSDKNKKLMDLAKKSVENLNNLVKDIVDFHKIEAKETEFVLAENDVNRVVDEVREAMVPLLAERKEVEFVVDADKELPRARFDREKIALVLANIVNIAIKSTEKGLVTVTTAREGDNAIRVSVKDSGPGVKEEDLSKLFDIFERPGKEKDKDAGGSGLGLTISKEIIERHKGKIWAESEIGKGTTFIFVLPISERRR